MSKVDHDYRLQCQAMPNSRFEEECDAVADEMRRMLPFEEECEVKEPDMSMRHIPITLNGPKSPLEINIYSSLCGAKTKKIGIEPQSVNSILLEANPQVCHRVVKFSVVISFGSANLCKPTLVGYIRKVHCCCQCNGEPKPHRTECSWNYGHAEYSRFQSVDGSDIQSVLWIFPRQIQVQTRNDSVWIGRRSGK